MSSVNLSDLLTTWAAAMTGAGIPAAQQLAAIRGMGIVIGRGGQGSGDSDLNKVCQYCGATGNGGHGGFCPSTGRPVTILELIAP